jgi:hypothetical protein
MNSVYDSYIQLWPEQIRPILKPHLSQVPVIHYPKERNQLTKVLPNYVVVVVEPRVSLREIFALVEMGFEHIVRSGREDFTQELLASSLMVLKTEAFVKNPIPFFFNGFRGFEINNADKNMTLKFTKSQEKSTLLDWLGAFLQQSPKSNSIRELCLQAADEMITNAIFNAPIKPSGKRPYQGLARTTEVELPANQPATLFACFSDVRVVIGCTDVYGSFEKDTLLLHLRSQFKEDKVRLREGQGGAGLGLRYLIENSANCYLLVHRGKSTLIASAFSLTGMRDNLSLAKHFHLSFR